MFGYNLLDSRPESRHHFCLKPRILGHPDLIARRRVDQREIVGQVVLVPSHPLCHLATDLLMKIVGLGVLANQEGQLNIWTFFEELRMPLFRKALARWQLT
jgi:hypothetical protein